MSQPQSIATTPATDAVPPSDGEALVVQGLFVGSGIPPTATSTPDPLPDADQFPLTKPVNATQLKDELAAALSREVLLALTGVDDSQVLSDTNPAVLWISPSGLDASVIETVIANHSPYAAYDVPKADQDYSAAVQKIMADHETALTQDERDVLLRGLVLRIETGTTTSPSPSFPSGAPTA